MQPSNCKNGWWVLSSIIVASLGNAEDRCDRAENRDASTQCVDQATPTRNRVAHQTGSSDEAAPPRLGDPNFRLNSKYAPIYGRLDGTDLSVHYCLPDFEPITMGKCSFGVLPGKGSKVIQVEYVYPLKWRKEAPPLEVYGAFGFPFSINSDVEEKTPTHPSTRSKDQ